MIYIWQGTRLRWRWNMIDTIALFMVLIFTGANIVLQIMTRWQYYTTTFDLQRRVEDLERQMIRMGHGRRGQ